MWYFLPEWIKFWKKRNAEPTQEEALSDIIKKRAEEQQSVIDRKVEELKEAVEKSREGKIAEKDFFE